MYRIEQRNKCSVGETIEIMKPDCRNIEVTVRRIVDEDGNEQESAPHPKQVLYIDFGEEAEQLAKEVGMMKATVITEGLRVRGEASSDGVLYGYLNLNDSVEVISDYNDGDEWVNVDYEGTSSYVSAEYVSVEIGRAHV